MGTRNVKGRAVFLDRDGTINREVDYLRRVKDFRLIAGAGPAIGALNRAGLKVVVASNQSGVARGLLTVEVLEKITRKMLEQLRRQGAGIDAVYYCPCHPGQGSNCRKPEIGMARLAQARFGLDLRRCFVVGDARTDIEFGKNMGARTALVLSGHSRGHELWIKKIRPDCIAPDLMGAAVWILEEVCRR